MAGRRGWVRRVAVVMVGAGLGALGILAGLRVGSVDAAGGSGPNAGPNPGTPAFYSQRVRPILITNCGKCHFSMSHKGGLAMDTRASMMKGGRNGRVIVPGDPADSMLVRLMRHQGPAKDPMPMPPKSPRMSDADIAVVEQWIKAGAAMPENGK